MNGGQVLVKMLLHHGVDTIFAMPGEQLDPFFAALYEHRNDIRVIHSRHEQGAAFMAYGYARSTGRVGAFIIPPGPGFLNTTAALATGYAGNTPMFCLTGQIPLDAIGRGFGVLHELPDQLGMLRVLTKWSARMEHPMHGPQLVNQAFSQLQTDRIRPVGIEVPSNVMAEKAEVDCSFEPAAITNTNPLSVEAIKQAAALLNSASKPIIMIGGGAISATKELLNIAEKLQAPVIVNCSGRGIISDRHYLSLTWPAGHHLWKEADVVMAVGTRLFQPQMQWGTDDALHIIRIDIDPTELSRVRKPTVGILADAKVALSALDDALTSSMVEPKKSRQRELVALKAEFLAKFSKLNPQYDYLMAIRDALPEDGYFVDELTQVGYVARFAFPIYYPRTYIPATYQGTLGFGFAAALGVKAAYPTKAVISISGDGGFLYNAQELATAVQNKLAVIAIIFNDNAYGNVKRAQIQEGYNLATDLDNPDFCELARAFGAIGVIAHHPEELRHEIHKALTYDKPTVIEVKVDKMPDPWKFIRLPKIR